MSQQDRNERAWRDPANWRGGPLGVYAAQEDDRAFVPKRGGFGATVNLSTGAGLGFVAGVLVFIGVLVWVSTRTPSRPARSRRASALAHPHRPSA